MSGKKLLQSALADIRTYGWIQAEYGSQKTGYCMMGALNANSHKYQYPSYPEAVDALQRSIGLRGDSLVYWNDRVGREKDEVVAVFLNAIDLLDKEAKGV